jgi:hypothetical protein
MNLRVVRSGLITCSLLLAFVLSPAAAQDPWHATKTEAAQLPRYCWGQLMGGDLQEQQFWISGCGSGVNHYCLGLLKTVRANKTIGNKTHKVDLLNGAKDDTLYTLNAIKNYPQCSIRQDAQQTLAKIESQLRLLR